jgi:hypothetical protein
MKRHLKSEHNRSVENYAHSPIGPTASDETAFQATQDSQARDARPNLAVPYQAPRAASSDQTTTADPISGTEALGRAMDLSEGRVLSTISCYGDDLSAVHSTFERLRGYRFSSWELASLGRPDIEAMAFAWENGESVTRTTTHSRFAALSSFASYLTVALGIDCSRLLFADLPPVQLPKMVVVDEAATARVSSSFSRIRDWTDLRDRAAILTVPCEQVGR